jgi:hypothetical protein
MGCIYIAKHIESTTRIKSHQFHCEILFTILVNVDKEMLLNKFVNYSIQFYYVLLDYSIQFKLPSKPENNKKTF